MDRDEKSMAVVERWSLVRDSTVFIERNFLTFLRSFCGETEQCFQNKIKIK